MIYDQIEIPSLEQQIFSSIMHIWKKGVDMNKIFLIFVLKILSF